MPKVKGARRFILFTTPTLADPQWVTPVVEFEDSDDPAKPGATPIEYRDVEELERVVKDMGRALARAAGYNAGAANVLQTFGLKVEDYYKRVKENKERADSKEGKNGEVGRDTTGGTGTNS